MIGKPSADAVRWAETMAVEIAANPPRYLNAEESEEFWQRVRADARGNDFGERGELAPTSPKKPS